MEIKQDPKFQPITITLETKREAEIIWDAIRVYTAKSDEGAMLRNMLGDWFSNESQL